MSDGTARTEPVGVRAAPFPIRYRARMATSPEPSDDLVDLVWTAFEHAFGSIEGGDTLIPFAITETAGERSLMRFVADTFEAGIEAGRGQLASLSPRPERAVLAFDGYVTTKEGRSDAIYVEAQDAGQSGFIFFMRYKPAKGLLRRKPAPIDDNPVLADDAPGFF